ncbi:MAG: hypothetical protein KDD25_01155 [Bdellovibrionales bacterium]|nr:hypothetical protein [Bdellovibrionales bacterium]
MSSNILKKLSENTGLPENLVTCELESLLRKAGLNKSAVTLDDIREVLADYLQDVIVEAKEKQNLEAKEAVEA